MTELINPEKLHQELKAAGLPVVGVSSAGRVDTEKALTKAQQDQVQSIISAHDPAPSEEEIFLEKLRVAGISTDQLVLALWQRVMLDDPALSEQQAKEINQLI